MSNKNGWQVVDHTNQRIKAADGRPEAKAKVAEFSDLELEVCPKGKDPKEMLDNGPTEDGNDVVVVEDTEPTEPPAEDALAQLGEELGTDPLEILPDHMKDRIQGKPAVNKRGYAMIAERYNIGTSAGIEVYPWENDEGRCVAHATAVTEDGREYSGWATACAGDGDMDAQIIELAETRALKRSVSWASGVGIVSYQELSNQLEDQGGQA